MSYQPPFTITHRLIDLVGLISERIGTWQASGKPPSPQLRRANQIRTIQASLAIENTLHPLLVSAAVHYEIEFIHPFTDGNGRIGRLWQTVQLSAWKPQLSIPVETIIKERQAEYYAALAASDKAADVAPFAEFSLQALLVALEAELASDQATDQATDQVKRLLSVLKPGDRLTGAEIMQMLDLKHRPTFVETYLRPAIAAGLVCLTHPDSPRSPNQRYFLNPKSQRFI